MRLIVSFFVFAKRLASTGEGIWIHFDIEFLLRRSDIDCSIKFGLLGEDRNNWLRLLTRI